MINLELLASSSSSVFLRPRLQFHRKLLVVTTSTQAYRIPSKCPTLKLQTIKIIGDIRSVTCIRLGPMSAAPAICQKELKATSASNTEQQV